jgi:peptidyl-prolyl cis-trans isomerase B (cyclophilin B)
MARTQDPHSATCQFFINLKDNHFLNYTSPDVRGWGYTVFGKVIEGHDVVDRIRSVETCRCAGHDDVPVEPVTIIKAMVEEEER